jgi:hypothetical protein
VLSRGVAAPPAVTPVLACQLIGTAGGAQAGRHVGRPGLPVPRGEYGPAPRMPLRQVAA